MAKVKNQKENSTQEEGNKNTQANLSSNLFENFYRDQDPGYYILHPNAELQGKDQAVEKK